MELVQWAEAQRLLSVQHLQVVETRFRNTAGYIIFELGDEKKLLS
jgi:hypothetical protein